MSRRKRTILKLVVSIISVIFIVAAIFFITSDRKTEYKQDETVKFNDFTLSIYEAEKQNIKFSNSNLIDFYKTVWGRTEKDMRDCSKFSNEKTELFQLYSPREDCVRVNDDIKRDLKSKKEIAAYENNNYRLNLTYAITSKNNYLGVGDVEVQLVSGEEDLSKKEFKYYDFYNNEAKIRYDNLIDKGPLTSGLTRTGLIWADVSNQTKVLQLKITFKGKIKTVVISDINTN